MSVFTNNSNVIHHRKFICVWGPEGSVAKSIAWVVRNSKFVNVAICLISSIDWQWRVYFLVQFNINLAFQVRNHSCRKGHSHRSKQDKSDEIIKSIQARKNIARRGDLPFFLLPKPFPNFLPISRTKLLQRLLSLDIQIRIWKLNHADPIHGQH